MSELNNTAMSRTLQSDECAKLLNIFEGGIHMSKAMNPVPIYHKITLPIDEAFELSNTGINRIDAMLPNQTARLCCLWGKRNW